MAPAENTNLELSNMTSNILSIGVFTCLTVTVIFFCRRWLNGARVESEASLQGKTAIVTGSNTGIGKETAKDFVRRGAKVILACRNVEKTNAAAEDIRSRHPKADIRVVKLDLSSLESVRQCAKEILDTEPRIHILVNNAGLMAPKGTTQDGFDLVFGTNHLGPFLFTYLLLERLKESAPARIVNVSALAHSFVPQMNWDDLNYDKPGAYAPMRAYSQSKLANVLFTKELAKTLEGTGVTTYAAYPGFVKTEFNRYNYSSGNVFTKGIINAIQKFAKTVESGAQTTLYCAVDESIANKSGMYYAECREKESSRGSRDPEAAKRLWDISLQMVGLTR